MKNFVQTFNAWKLAIFRAFLLAFLAAYTTLQTSLNGIEWAQISPTQKFILVCGVIAAAATSIVAFLDKTIASIEARQNQPQPDQPPPAQPKEPQP